MTKDRANDIKKSKRYPKDISPRQLLFCFMSLFSLALIIKNSDIAIEYMSEGLLLCAKTVIPSLFPFMVISDVIVASGAASFIGRILKAPMRFLFGISGEGACSVILGTLCGFPIGARSAVATYDAGKISKGELERLLTFSNNPSSAFIISAVGVSLFGCRDFGISLYAITLISSLVVGVLQRLFFSSRRQSTEKISEHIPAPKAPQRLGIGDFTEAITSSAFGILRVCAFVVFFSAFIGTLGSVSDSVTMPQHLKALLFGVFELTGGMAQAASVIPAEDGALLAAFIAGWSGISVHFQIMSICSERNISFKPYFAAKLLQGGISALLMKLYFLVVKPEFLFHSESVSESVSQIIPVVLTDTLTPVIFSLFCLVILFGISKKISATLSHKKKD